MRILLVHSGNRQRISPFVKEQAESLEKAGLEIFFFSVGERGPAGYLRNLPKMKEAIRQNVPDIVHAHYGFSGLLAALQRLVPVVVTFHGSDINVPANRPFSFLAARFADTPIFVHPDLPAKIRFKHRQINMIPCGVNIETFRPIPKKTARDLLHMDYDKEYILFSSAFDKSVKNYHLAKKAVDSLGTNFTLIELKGYTREEVNWLINAVDALLVTSFSETGPLVVKEAMACNRPIVATDVGDVRWLFGDTEGCYIASFEPEDVAEKLKMALRFSETRGRTVGRYRIMDLGLDSESIAWRIINVYESVLQRNGLS